MVDINLPNLVTVGLISVAAWALANYAMKKTGVMPPWAG